MGFRSEIDEQLRQERAEQAERLKKVEVISEYCREHNLPFSEIDKDKILHPEDYDDWGGRRHFT